MYPDYKKYTLIELYDVKKNIDKELYPEKYEALLSEIKLREEHLDEEPKLNNLDEKDKASILKVIMSICAIYFSWTLIQAYKKGAIWYKRDHEYFLDTQPEGFYFVVIIHVIFIVTALYIVFKDFGKTALETPTFKYSDNNLN
jgi:uncharacterized membrane protein YqhA